MIFNLLYGDVMQLEVASGAFANLTAAQLLKIPLTVEPVMVLFRTTVGSSSELAAYYRPAAAGEFSLRVGGGAPAKCRMDGVYSTQLIASVTGATKAGAANVEYYIMGVKK